MASLSLRPNTASIFASDPVTFSKILAFLLVDVAIPVPNRVRLDLTHSVQAGPKVAVARSPVERAVADNIRILPEPVTVVGSLSATPLGPVATRLGGFGSAVRRDLIELEKLRRIQARREPVVLVTPARVYQSMAMSIGETHTGTHKVDLVLNFEPIVIVSPLSVTGVLDLNELLAGASSTSQAGAQPTSTVPEPSGVGGGLG